MTWLKRLLGLNEFRISPCRFLLFRNSRWQVFYRIAAQKTITKFPRKTEFFLVKLNSVILKLLKHATLLKVTLLHGCFSRFLNCSNGSKSRNARQDFIYKSTEYFIRKQQCQSPFLVKLQDYQL